MKYLECLARHARAILCKSPTATTPNAAFGDKERLRASLAASIADLEEGRAIISRALDQPNPIPDEVALKELDAVLFLNWAVAIGSYIPIDPSPNPAELTIKFRACNALGNFRAALQQLPYEWRVPYGGLDIASRLRASDDDQIGTTPRRFCSPIIQIGPDRLVVLRGGNIRIAILPPERRHRLHLDPEMIDQDQLKPGIAMMGRLQGGNPCRRMVRRQNQLAFRRPTLNSSGHQPINPRIELPAPVGDVPILNVSDHGRAGM